LPLLPLAPLIPGADAAQEQAARAAACTMYTLVACVAMAGRGGGSKSSSLYVVLGVASDCSDADLCSAYRKLAMVGDLLCFLCFPLSCLATMFRSKIPTLLIRAVQ